jgi:hypothetical protein
MLASFLLGFPLAAGAQQATLGISTSAGADVAPGSPLCDQALSHLINYETKQEVRDVGELDWLVAWESDRKREEGGGEAGRQGGALLTQWVWGRSS